ncbi:MAG: DUF2007 domain-containing protein [bacterium]
MPYCPSCGYEYEEGVEVCPDCRVELVEALSEDHFEGEMAEVYHAHSYPEAGMVKELLYNEGIFSALSNEMGSTMLGSTSSEMGEIKVFVSEENAKLARELIETYMESNPLEEAGDYIICHNCSSQYPSDYEACPYCGTEAEEEE